MRICFVCNEYPPFPHGGQGSLVQALARRLSEQGHSVQVVGCYEDLSESLQESDSGIRIFRLRATGKSSRSGFLMNRLRLGRWLGREWKRGNYDIVEFPESGGWALGLPPGIPYVVRLHNLTPFLDKANGKRRGILLTGSETATLFRASGVVAVSQFMADVSPDVYGLSKYWRRRLTVVYNGIDLEEFPFVPYSKRVPGRVVFAGTLKPQKGLRPLLEGFCLALRTYPCAELVLAGKDTQVAGGRSYLETLQEKLGLDLEESGQIRVLGHVNPTDLSKLYASASVCVFPSLGETFGLVAAEAMSTGRPVVYSRRTAGPELIEHGTTGLLVDPTCPEGIGGAILSILETPSLGEEIGRAAAAEVRNRFSIDRCAQGTLAIYKELLQRVPDRA